MEFRLSLHILIAMEVQIPFDPQHQVVLICNQRLSKLRSLVKEGYHFSFTAMSWCMLNTCFRSHRYWKLETKYFPSDTNLDLSIFTLFVRFSSKTIKLLHLTSETYNETGNHFANGLFILNGMCIQFVFDFHQNCVNMSQPPLASDTTVVSASHEQNLLHRQTWNHIWQHYSDTIMSAMTSQITSVSIVCSNACTGQRKHQSSASLAFPVTGEFPAQRASNAENVSIMGMGNH